jgi:hypothetical protein
MHATTGDRLGANWQATTMSGLSHLLFHGCDGH